MSVYWPTPVEVETNGDGTPREVATIEMNGMVGSIAHLAYHLGAIRQMNRAARGPSADD